VCVLRLAALVNIDAAADVAGECSRIVRKRDSSIEDPPVLSVVPTKAVFHLERFPSIEVVQIMGDAALEIIRVDALRPPAPHARD
jgi:hypothetical protein